MIITYGLRYPFEMTKSVEQMIDSILVQLRNQVENDKVVFNFPHNNILLVITYRSDLNCKKCVLYETMMSRENKIIIQNV